MTPKIHSKMCSHCPRIYNTTNPLQKYCWTHTKQLKAGHELCQSTLNRPDGRPQDICDEPIAKRAQGKCVGPGVNYHELDPRRQLSTREEWDLAEETTTALCKSVLCTQTILFFDLNEPFEQTPADSPYPEIRKTEDPWGLRPKDKGKDDK